MEPTLNDGMKPKLNIEIAGTIETIDESDGKVISQIIAVVPKSNVKSGEPDLIDLQELSEGNMGVIQELRSVESWLLLPTPVVSLQDHLEAGTDTNEASVESESTSVHSSCRGWMELPCSIDHYMSAEVQECCKFGVTVSYQRDGLGSTFTPLFQM
jgi:hypothetical protein